MLSELWATEDRTLDLQRVAVIMLVITPLCFVELIILLIKRRNIVNSNEGGNEAQYICYIALSFKTLRVKQPVYVPHKMIRIFDYSQQFFYCKFYII